MFKFIFFCQTRWHYICTNIYTALRPFYNINDQQVIDNLRLRGARVYPPSNGMYIDTTSIRSQLPDNYGDKYLETSRRIHPSIQYLDRSLHVAKSYVSNGYRSIKISFKSRNCASNLPNFTLVDSFPLNEAKLTKLSSASPPVTGSFNISWNGHTLAGKHVLLLSFKNLSFSVIILTNFLFIDAFN